MAKNNDIKALQQEVERLKAALRNVHELELEREESRLATLALLEDLKQSHAEIEHAKHEWMNAFDAIDDPIFIHDEQYRVVRANYAYAELAGIAIQDVIGRLYYECFPISDGPMVSCSGQMQQDTQGMGMEELYLDDGRIFLSRAFAIHDSEGNYQHSIHIMHDITENRRAEQAVAKSEKRYRSLFDDALDMIQTVDSEGNIEDINAAELAILGYSRDELVGQPMMNILHPERREQAKQCLQNVLAGNELKAYETVFIRHDGAEIPVEITAVPRKTNGKIIGVRSIIRDISERKLAERTLADNEEKFHSMTATAQDAILMIGEDGCINYYNPAAEKLFGYTGEEMAGRDLHDLIVPKRYREHAHKGFENFAKTGRGEVIGKTMELEALRRDGSEFPVELSVSAIRVKGQWNAVSFIRDISERKTMEEKLRRENRARRVISGSNSALVHATDETRLLQDICGLIVAESSYPLAWVGLKQDDRNQQPYEIAAYAGVITEEDLPSLGCTFADNENGQGLAARAMHEYKYQLINDAQKNVPCENCRKLAIKYDYHSILVFSLIQGGDCFGALTITAKAAEGFSKEEIEVLQELADDMGYGIIALRTLIARDRAEQQQHIMLEKLKTNLGSTVQAMADAVEARDPYTAGHQRHVAELASAIATEMGLSENDVEGIRIAATIHDLGKIYVPSEILSKPGRISKIEFELIKTHSQVGYDILKNIDFPWPVAKIVLQHHERIDGSGYPQGLKGDEIELGAKIIGVADVVEAISSHRPYRASLGIDFALETVEKDRGIAFDLEVVDACLRLFREKDYELDLS